MNIFDKKKKKVVDASPKEEKILENSEYSEEFPEEEEIAEATEAVEENEGEEVVSEPEKQTFKITYEGKKYNVSAYNKEDALNRLLKFFGREIKEAVEGASKSGKEKFILTVNDIYNAISEEISRIVTVAHPESCDQSYDRWIAVITEELGEIVHEINDEFEGKKPSKNTFVECVQLCAATILLAKKFASEHGELFEGEEE